jgi:hypothetical protein
MAYIPTLNGDSIFGIDTVVTTGTPQIDQQINKFMGVIGVEVLTMGSGHYNSTVRGKLVGTNIDDLAAAEQRLRSYRNGLAYDFTSTDGLTYPLVMLVAVETVPRLFVEASSGMAWRMYQATLLHLI